MTRGSFGPVHTKAPETSAVSARKPGRPRGSKDTVKRKRKRITLAHETPAFSKARSGGSASGKGRGAKQGGQKGEEEGDEGDDEDREPSAEEDLSESEMSDEEEDEAEQPQIEPPCHVLFVAETQCGKTNAFKNVFPREYYDNVFVVSATGSRNPKDCDLRELCNDDKCIWGGITTGAVEDLIDYHEAVKKEFGRYPRTAIVFDDFMGIKGTNVKTDPILNLLASAGRHFFIDLWYLCQVLDQIPPVLRRNAFYQFFGKNSEGVIKLIADTLATPSMGGKKKMHEMLSGLERQVGRYPFLYVDKRKRKHFIWEAPELKVSEKN